ncbi:putative sugar-binding periplasmic protein precursor [Haloferax massiliensis]|uniref:Putative sugar-binding periplasmic protein n=1 Tax=Haloferax massiliensis TaxID=1476858 RepID=A0A0D6JT05_9EURY|nr:putative sugar-binding periplasmic protein precursor [Haloferax massiliensis]
MSRDSQSDDSRLSRRQYVAGAGALATMGLAGCSGGGGSDDGGDGSTTEAGGDGGDSGTSEDGGDGGNSAPVEVLHGWTGGDGAAAAEALEEAFNEAYPDVGLDMNPIGGGGNQNLDAVVANRLQSDDPPGSFANWPGPNLLRYEGVLGSVDDVWEENNFEEVMIDEAVELHKQGGSYRAVPLGSHRLNCLFYNVSVVEEAGIDVESLNSPSALIDAFETVQSETDAVPMTHAMSGTWTTTQLWGAVMLGVNGYQPYMDFLNGEASESAVRSAFETTAEMLENYISDDAASLNLTSSNQNIINGNAAFIHQGNWAAGAFRNAENFDYGEDWGFKTFPGTEGMYTLHMDSFLYPADNPTPEASKAWSAFVGSPEAQIAFNQYKGSIPTRTDVSMDEFGPYLQETAEDFANAEYRPPNLQHGLGVPSETMTALNEVISSEFTGPYNVDAATQGFLDAVSN